MKGITHFVSGVTVATFFKSVMQATSAIGMFPLAIGGIFGLLPDTIDFKLYQFFRKFNYVIDPDPDNLDPQAMAETVAKAINEAYDTGKLVEIKLHTMQLASNLWRRYTLKFDTEEKKVIVKIGPIVTTGKVPYPESELKDQKPGVAAFKPEIIHTYEKETEIDIFNGPSYGFEKEGDRVRVVFIPFHRRWSHSITMASLIGAVFMFWGYVPAIIAFIAFMIHILEDQLGFMGSNLFYPFTKKRVSGQKVSHSDNAFMNFFTVWLCAAIVLWNVNRFASEPVIQLDPVSYFAILVIIPWLIIGIATLLYKLYTGVEEKETIEEAKAREAMEEAREIF